MLIQVRDVNLVPVAEIDSHLELRWVDRLHAVGGWQLTAAPDTIGPLLEPGHGLTVLDDDGSVLCSGPVGISAAGLPTFKRSIAENGTDSIVVTGIDDHVAIADRLAWPEPSNPGSPATEVHDVRRDVASTVVLGYIDANAGPGALASRRTPYLELGPDLLIGSTVTGRARYANLLALVDELATAGGIVVTVRQSGRRIVVDVRARSDRSADVVFSVRYGNVQSADYATEPSTATWVIAAGAGEGTARLFASTPDPVGRRIELFADQRSIDDLTELAAAASSALIDGAGRHSFTFRPLESDGLRYGRDFRLGDLVAVDIDGTRFVDVVAAVETVSSSAGITRSMTIGRESTSGALALVHGIRSLSRRLSALERI